MDKIITEIETQVVFPDLQREVSRSAFQACHGNYCGRAALILIPVKEQNANCCFPIHVHQPAQQDLGPHLQCLKGYQVNKYS